MLHKFLSNKASNFYTDLEVKYLKKTCVDYLTQKEFKFMYSHNEFHHIIENKFLKILMHSVEINLIKFPKETISIVLEFLDISNFQIKSTRYRIKTIKKLKQEIKILMTNRMNILVQKKADEIFERKIGIWNISIMNHFTKENRTEGLIIIATLSSYKLRPQIFCFGELLRLDPSTEIFERVILKQLQEFFKHEFSINIVPEKTFCFKIEFL